MDTNWLLFHGVLPTKDRLIKFKMNVDPLCFCRQPESLLRLFIQCSFSISVLEWFLSIFRLYDRSKVNLLPNEVLFGFSDNKIPSIFSAILGVIRHNIWLTRNQFVFDKKQPHLENTLKNIKSTTRFITRMQCRKSRDTLTEHEWLADGVIGSFSPADQIIFSRKLI